MIDEVEERGVLGHQIVAVEDVVGTDARLAAIPGVDALGRRHQGRDLLGGQRCGQDDEALALEGL
jgi:hypothetical protein